MSMIPIIIPAYEPDERLLMLLEELNKANLGPVVIVNDGSGVDYDALFAKAKDSFGAILLNHEINAGKGKALKTAFKYCLEQYDDLVGCITADSDGQHSVNDIKIISDCLANTDELILGVRDFDGPDIPEKSKFGNRTTRKVFKRLYKTDISDTQTGLRGIPVSLFKEFMELPGDRFEYETQMLIYVSKKKIGIKEIPIETIYDSKENHTTHFRPVVDAIRIYSLFAPAFFKFLLSSASSSVIDLLLFQLFCAILKGVSNTVAYAAVATVIARVFSAIYNYLVNYFLVFNSSKNIGTTGIRYLSLAVVQMLCSAALTSGLLMLTGANPELLVKVPVDICLFIISFQIQKRFVY